MSSSLIVWMNGQRVGVWTQARGSATFQYDPAWAAAPNRRRVSLSLDFQPGNAEHKGAVVTDYFDNLLPDSEPIRQRLQSRFGTESRQAFDLLKAIGRDCVGAVQLLPEGEEPSEIQTVRAEPLDDEGVERAIGAALSGSRVLGQADAEEFRISIAGAQEKIALLRHQNQWCRPLGATPTTHILKLPLGVIGNMQANMQDSVENEWLCLRLMAAFGLDTARAEIREFINRKVLVVERFDRVWQDDTWIARRPQEDFCQALGRPGHRKYESEGGPGMKDILDVLAFSADSTRNRRDFAKAQLIFWLMAATDGHAKNFSLFHEQGGIYRLTPFYDVLSAWPIIGPGTNQLAWQKATLAMAIRGKNPHRKLMDIKPRHWQAVAKQAGLGDADNLINEVLQAVPKVLAAVEAEVPENFPGRIQDTIFEGIQQQAKVLAAG
ncbi:MAG: type II toxin-antitoxin system HipA family toxin [Candidatus Didemnitutus sp.]|nr:type II toxin-antitoxin system HipA family toxin [Candidatus Didemnitutus sp.]